MAHKHVFFTHSDHFASAKISSLRLVASPADDDNPNVVDCSHLIANKEYD